MNRKKTVSLFTALLLCFLICGCMKPDNTGQDNGTDGTEKQLALVPEGGVFTISANECLRIDAYHGDIVMPNAVIAVNSGPAEMSGQNIVYCRQSAKAGDTVELSAKLSGFRSAKYILTVTDNNSNEEDEPIMESPWNKEPKVKNIFYDDFSDGIKNSVWEVSNQKWGANNNGTSAGNVFYSTNSAICSEFGAESGGVAVLGSKGDFYRPNGTADKSRTGSCIITKQPFGPGKYEVRLKVVPRLGQCSALWTYYNGGGGSNFENYLQNKYSEIDIEMPLWASYRNILGVSYQYFNDNWDWNTQVVNRRDAVYAENKQIPPYNDGKWHTLCFEWRNDKANGDRAVIWYLDGKEFGRATQWVPEYTATFWIGNWFPDDVGWIGQPLFEDAYMYVDWVRITEYDDPSFDGARGGTGGNAANLGNLPIPLNNYISNGQFAQDLTVKNIKGQNVTSWNASNAAKGDGLLNLFSNGRAEQVISGQYHGYTFNLEIEAQKLSGSGKCKVYAEFLSGRTDIINPVLTVVEKSQEIYFSELQKLSKNLTFTVSGGLNVEHIRIVIQTEQGTTAAVYSVKLFLL